MPSVSASDLTPYVTLLLLRAPTPDRQKQSVSSLLEDIERLVKSLDDDVSRRVIMTGGPKTEDGTTIGFLHFTERRRPTWLSKNASIELHDLVHQLIVVIQMKDLVAICSSDSAYYQELTQTIANADGTHPAMEQLAHIKTDLLNAAFVDGPARTLWLSGIHRPTAVKADAKVLAGLSLARALNPLGDQSYTFSAVRCSVTSQELTRAVIGVTPRKSRVWSGTSASYTDFRDQVGGILKHLHRVDVTGAAVESPLPYLAVAVTDSTGIEGAYDLTVVAPELLSDDQALNPEERALAEKYALRSRFEVTGASGPNFRVKVHADGVLVGTFDVTINLAPDGRVTHQVTPVSAPSASPGVLEREALRVLRRRDWLGIYYESGHTISQGSCFRYQFRDQRFDGWDWRPFSGYAVHREKPTNGATVAFDEIGTRDSLFCFTHKHWSRLNAATASAGRSVWLACDDGANEIADFIRFECGGATRPRLTLIHVKGSHSELPTRDLSVSAYEVVVGQAVKNVRALSVEHILNLLDRGGQNATKRFAWRDGKLQADRQDMIAAIRGADELFECDVVIVQPSARRSQYSRALPVSRGGKASQPPGWYYRRAQLDALLIGAQATCHEVGARLIVVADDS